ncbi:MAG: aspartyl-tRNA(Asn)/glutamyl-tRNA(Gln) amidotransferase subunit A [Gammaproteobacteria bacterium]|jgi:aspartyl-tRNA(Asn)/glutamyl-tRNA(Gln) amidotransferase subunit A
MSIRIPWSVKNSRERQFKTLERIEKNADDVKSVFTSTFTPAINALNSGIKSPVAGALISVKDLFDVEGRVTRAGTRFMENDESAASDAIPVKQLKDAGAILLGHTNMTELAYSGLGLNPHYGTPANALHADCVPGGSSAGGAVSVALGLADIAIGTDTGGSLRIPAAFNGIVGFKPSQISVSRQGCKTLSGSLDSVGPMASNVNACRLAFNAMRRSTPESKTLSKPTFVIPTNFGTDDLDTTTSDGFYKAVDKLSDAGFTIETRSIPVLNGVKNLAAWQFAAVEARAEYEYAFDKYFDLIDPRVSSRIARADEVSALDFCKILNARVLLIEQYRLEESGRIVLMPTTPIVAPKLSDLIDDDDAYYSTNALVLRNPSVANVLDGCSISLPFKHKSHSIGVMLTAPAYHDDALLSLALKVEGVLSN